MTLPTSELPTLNGGRPFWRRPLKPVDASLSDAGHSGELLVARIRLVTTLALLPIPVHDFQSSGGGATSRAAVAVMVLALAYAGALYALLERGIYRAWLGIVSSAIDISLVSLLLAVYVLLGAPHAAVNNRVAFEVFFLAIAASSLRYDTRICLATGGLAILQYMAIVAFASLGRDLNGPEYAPFRFGLFSWSAELGRVLVLVAATFVSAAVVARAQDLRLLSSMDRLTGLWNRGHLDERLAGEAARARRAGRPLAVAMLDLDHFKAFNDTLGHAAGDESLRAVARLIRRQVRRSDIVARYGGEEMVVILPETTIDVAVDKMEMIRKSVRELKVPAKAGAKGRQITVSIGVAALPDDGETPEALLGAADARLFAAKSSGRDRVVDGARLGRAS